jgi:hypothetical protein
MSDDNQYEREGDDPRATLKANVEARIKSMMDQADLELGEAPPPSVWEVYALGPFQTYSFPAGPLPPGRIIELGETAYLITVVFLNTFMDTELTDFGAKVQLNYFTSNMQAMQPVSAMDYSCCLDPGEVTGIVTNIGTFYVTVWEFEPTEAACILETNICARICNCENEVVRARAAFVRWIANLDFDLFFPPVFYQFDHPVRYLVYDNDDDTNCDCQEECVDN